MSGRKIQGHSLFRRGEQWVLAYQVTPGVWRQHRVPAGVETKRAAEQYALAWLAEQRSSGKLGIVPGSSATVADIVPKWISLREANPKVRRSTVADNKSHLKTHILPSSIGRTPIDLVTPGVARDWIRQLRGVRSARTVQHVVSTMSSLMEDAIVEGWTTQRENPFAMASVRKEVPEAEDQDPISLTPDEFHTLMACEAVPIERRLRYLIGVTTGLRDGEVSGGKWLDLDLASAIPTWTVSRACAIRGEAGHGTLGAPKNKGSKRVLSLHPSTAFSLQWWHDVGCEMLTGYVPTDDGPIFPSPVTGWHWRGKTARDLRRDLKAAGLPTKRGDRPIESRHLRSTFATWLYEAGVEESTRARLMGHADKTVTLKHYTSAILAKLHAAVLLLQPLRCAKDCAPRTKPTPDDDTQTYETPACSAGSAPVAQWIEQRFPKTIHANSIVRDECSDHDETSVFDALTNGLEPDEARLRYASAQRLHNVVGDGAGERSARAADLIEGAVAVALDAEMGSEEKARELEGRLREAGELLAWGGYGST